MKSSANSQLSFEIVQFTGQEKDYPMDEIKKSQQKSKGWQSQRFCEYPQEVIVKLTELSQIKQIEFLSHQSKICTKVEIYISSDQKFSEEIDQVKFKKLGYLQFDDNQRSNYQSRELKSVYIDNRCMFMKLVLHKCHMNKYNLFNQIGLIGLTLHGIPAQQPQQGQQQFNFHNNVNNNNNNQNNQNNQGNTALQQQLKALQIQKSKAIQNEDFDQAQQIKDQIEKIQNNSNQINYLEEKKQIAVNNEDYESAQIIKKEIEKIKGSFQNFANKQHQNQQANQQTNNNNQQYYQKQSYNQNYNQTPNNEQYSQNTNQNTQNNIPYEQQQNNNNYQSNRGTNREQSREQKREEEQEPQQEQSNIDDLKSKYKKKIKQQQNPQQVQDSTVVREQNLRMSQPIRGMKQEQQVEEYEHDQPEMSESLEVEELTNKQREDYSDLIESIGEQMVRQICSKQFKIREQSAEQMIDELRNPQQLYHLSQQQILEVAVRVVQILLGDKIVSVIMQALSLYSCVIKKLPKKTSRTMESVINMTIDKLGDNNTKIREGIENSIISLDDQGIEVLRQLGTQLNPRQNKNIKHICHRLKVIIMVLTGTGGSGEGRTMVVDMAKSCLDNINSDVRQNALALLQTVINQYPTQYDDQITGIKQVFLDQLNHSAQPQPVKQQRNNNQMKQQKGQKEVQEQQECDDKGECELCGISRREFIEDNWYDQHLVRECKLARECVECEQIIGVEDLNGHLLEECQYSSEYQQCPKCREAIHQDNQDEHQKMCIKAKPANQYNRCPLCHQDTQPGLQGLRKHLLNNQCPAG